MNYLFSPLLRKSNIPYFFLIGNLILKIIFINYPDVSLDEPFTIFHSQKSLSELFTIFKTENNPPLFFLLTHFAIKIGGIYEFSVRILPVIFSSLSVFFLYKLVNNYAGTKQAIVTSFLFTFSNYHFFVAHECRAYGLFGLLTILSFYTFLNLVNSENKKHLILLGVINVLLMYNHFFGIFIPFVQLIACITLSEFRKTTKSLFLSGIVSSILYLPYLSLLLQRFGDSSSGTWVQTPTFMSLYYCLWSFSNMPLPTIISLILLISGLTYVLLNKNLQLTTFTKFNLIAFLVPFLTMFLISFKLPMFIPKYLIHCSFPFYILIAISVFSIPLNKKIATLLAVILCSSFLFTFKPTQNKLEVSKLSNWIKENKTEKMAVIFLPNYLDIQIFYHYDKKVFQDYLNFNKNIIDLDFYPVESLNDLKNHKNIFTEKYTKILYIGSGAEVVDPNHSVKQYLTNSLKAEQLHFYHNDDIVLFSKEETFYSHLSY